MNRIPGLLLSYLTLLALAPTPLLFGAATSADGMTLMRSSTVLGSLAPEPVLEETTIGLWNPDLKTGNMSTTSSSPGTIFSLSVNITQAPEFDRYQFNLEFHPRIIQLVSWSLEGTLLWPDFRFTQVSEQYPGIWQVFVWGTRTALGGGVLLFATFRVLDTGLSPVTITESALNLGGTLLTHRVSGGCFNNRTPRAANVDFSTSPTPRFWETSEYMAGRIAVGVILPESSGPRLNWTDFEVRQALESVRLATQWWAGEAAFAGLSFFYDEHVRAPTAYEPIETSPDSVWIEDVMSRLGYSGSAFDAVLSYDNDIRNRFGTDWAFTIFILDSDVRSFAYAYINGPMIVMSRTAGGFLTAAHEMGHIFGATDEYDSQLQYSGYLWASDYDGGFGLMNTNQAKVPASTRAQVGLLDCDGDSIIDLLDTEPAIVLDSVPTGLTESTSSRVLGRTVLVPYPTYHPGRRDMSIDRIVQVQYAVDRGTPAPAVASDGAFDEAIEQFYFDLAGLSTARHMVFITAFNSVGNFHTINLSVQVESLFRFDWADYDNNGVVDIVDVRYAASCFGKTHTANEWSFCRYWDLNLNGRVDIIDVAFAAGQFGKAVVSPFPGEGQPPGSMDPSWRLNCASLDPIHRLYCESR